MVFARLFLGGGFFALWGCFFLRAITTATVWWEVLGGTLYMPTRHRLEAANAVNDAYIRNIHLTAGRWSQKLMGQPLRGSSRQGFCK